MTPPTSDSIRALIEAQQAAFAQAPRRSLADRRRDLAIVEALVLGNEDAIAEAIDADFGGRSRNETRLLEIAVTAQAARHARKNLARWMKVRTVPTPSTAAPGRSLVRQEPKGVVGIVAPWNYPVQLSLVPLVAALAAGCRVLIKPSELTPRTSELMARLLAERFPADQVAVVTGGADVAEIFCSQRFDHLFYTGSTRIGRSVAQAAARNLTPVTLELGGKSPVIVDAAIPLDRVAHPLAWGRFLNAGQTCVAPDYVLALGNRAEALGQAVIRQAGVFYPDFASNPDYTAIVSDRHHARLTAMIDEARHRGVQVLQLPHDAAALAGSRRIAPTVMIDPPADLAVMREEIFGPVLTIYVFEDKDFSHILDVANGTSPYALTGAIFANDRAALALANDKLRHAAGNYYINDKPTGAVVGQQPFGGGRASGTNDKAGSMINLYRWLSPRTMKENMVPPTDYRYPFLGEE